MRNALCDAILFSQSIHRIQNNTLLNSPFRGSVWRMGHCGTLCGHVAQMGSCTAEWTLWRLCGAVGIYRAFMGQCGAVGDSVGL